MITPIKDFAKKTLMFLHIDVSPNIKYDRLSIAIMKKVLKPDSNCIDVGCHRGVMMDEMLRFSPKGRHIGFEPIPDLYKYLVEKYGKKVDIKPHALSNETGTATFNHVKNAAAFSGLKERKYDTSNPEIEVIEVKTVRLDDLLSPDYDVRFIKIDVEGGEYGVFLGAIDTLKRCKPVVLFECGLGASDYYGTDPSELFKFLRDKAGYGIHTLQGFMDKKAPLTESEFLGLYQTNKEFYFAAAPLN